MSSLRLDFSAAPAAPAAPDSTKPEPTALPRASSPSPSLFGPEQQLPPTWSEDSTIFHTWAKCTRLQSIQRNRRITGNPGRRAPCLNCAAIAATHRRG